MASNSDDDRNFIRIQHLIDEMDRSNQRINLFTENPDVDDPSGRPVSHRPSTLERQFNALMDDPCRSEESDGASVQEVRVNHSPKDLDDSGCEEVLNSAIAEVSKDFLSGLQTSGLQNQYGDSDESRISSDNDFKLLCGMPSYARYPETAAGLSDTDWNPYGTESDSNQSPHLQTNKSLAKEPKFSSITPFQPIFNSTGLTAITPNSNDKISSINSTSHLSGIREVTERDSSVCQVLKPDTSGNVTSITHKPDWAITPKKVQRKTFSSNYEQNAKDGELDIKALHHSAKTRIMKEVTSPKDSGSSDEEKKMIASTSSTGYSSATSGVKMNWEDKAIREQSQPQHMSVFERAKLMGIPEHILLDQRSTGNRRNFTEKNSGNHSDCDSDDHLGKKVKHILSETAYLNNRSEKRSFSKAAVDYSLLQKDLQEIQDNLESISSGSPGDGIQDWKRQVDSSLSDKEGDVPSTGSTPDRNRNNPVWDFAEVIGSLADRIQANGEQRQRSNLKNVRLNSDGDETRSSDSSHKSEDLIAAPDGLQSNHRDLDSSRDIDQMLSTFRDQRHQLESRYQQLSNQGLAEKVFRILTNQDPELQANGILSEISAEEKEMRANIALKQHQRDFNFSSNSSFLENSGRSFGPPDDIRKKLDLSGLSSVDSSRALDKSSFNLPAASRGFSAFDDAKRFLSSQMAKASEKTFNHSIEMRYPQSIQCYPILMDKTDKDDGENQKEERDSDSTSSGGAHYGNDKEDGSSSHPPGGKSNPPQDFLDKDRHDSPTNVEQSSTSRPKEKYRPYRPPGSKEVYYTESDTASVADSVTTMESTHLGSDDAAGPYNLPQSAYGSRKEAPNVVGIYGSRKNLSTVQESTEPSSVEELSNRDDKGSNSSKRSVEEPPASSFDQHRISSQQDASNRRSDRPVTTQRYNTSIWAKRDEPSNKRFSEEKQEGTNQRQIEEVHKHVEPVSPNHSVSAARRNAQWANRVEESRRDPPDINAEAELPSQHISSQRLSRPSHRHILDTEKEERTRPGLKQDFTLPSNAFVSEGQNSHSMTETEPMSLKIKLAYTDTNKTAKGSPHRDNAPEKDSHWPRSRFTHDDNDLIPSERSRFQPDQHNMYNHNLVRSASDENLNLSHRDARLSPAFRRALSPELMNSIGSRSPLLGRNIERSLAQPPSDYPSPSRNNRSTSPFDRRPYLSSDPPTFLARERSFSPREFMRSPINEHLHGQMAASARGSHNVSPSCDGRTRNLQTSPSRRHQTPEKKEDYNRFRPRQVSPHSFSKRGVELTLEGMSSESEADVEIDAQPISKRAQLLKDALSQDKEPNMSPDINVMWEQFKAYNESDDSSVNTARMEAVADLLKSPSTHFVSQYLKEREEYRIERQERVEQEKENRMKEHVQAHKSSSSEDDFGGRYHGLLAAKEEERLKRRSSKKKKGKNGDSSKVSDVSRGDKKNDDKWAESLYSIPEDRSSDLSPGKMSSAPKNKAKVSSQPNVIDPNMLKLREKISNQKKKVNRDMMKEMIRIEKLKKLEQLLKAKRKGEITSQMLEQQLEELSSTSHTVSDNSLENFKSMEPNSGFISDDSTTAKDSSGEMRRWKLRKENQHKKLETPAEKDEQWLRNNNNNKENKPRHESTRPSRQVPHHSEIKLLKLVKEGYLTAEEAYRVALTRKGHQSSNPQDDMSMTSSENDSSFSSNRPHRYYSPYSRSSNTSLQARHIPKLKFSDRPVESSTYNYSRDYLREGLHGQDDSEINAENYPGRKTAKEINSMRSLPVNRRQEKERARSQSPPVLKEYRLSGQRKTAPSSYQSRQRAHSSSPSRRSKDQPFFSSKGKQGKRYTSENDPSVKKKGYNRAVAWQIDMDNHPSQWKEPRTLQEISPSAFNKPLDERFCPAPSSDENKGKGRLRQKHPAVDMNIWQKSDHPQGIPRLQWEQVVSQDALASKTNHWEVDPIMDRVQYILNKPSSHVGSQQSSFTSSRGVDGTKKSLSKLSLQDAFLQRKHNFISSCRARQKRLALAKEDRQMQECLRLEREAIFAEQERLGPANIYAHPYSDNLYQPKRRILTKQEMREMTAKKYKNLPEVVEKKEENRRKIESRLNRLRANLFNKKVQKEVLKKTYKQRG